MSPIPPSSSGDSGGIFKTCGDLTDGLHILTVFPSGQDPFEISFQINSLGTNTPTISPAPTKAPVTMAPTISKAPTLPNQCGYPRLVGNWITNNVKYPRGVSEAQGDIIGNDFLIVGGFWDENGGIKGGSLRNWVRDLSEPETQWREVDPLPTEYGITHGAFVVVGNVFYMCGGYQGTTSIAFAIKCRCFFQCFALVLTNVLFFFSSKAVTLVHTLPIALRTTIPPVPEINGRSFHPFHRVAPAEQ